MIFARKSAEGFLDVVVRRIARNPERGVVIFEFDGHFVIRGRISLAWDLRLSGLSAVETDRN
jgi:hypothetical protein